MTIDCKRLLLVYVIAVIGVLSVIGIENAFALDNKVSVVGNFEGKFDHEMINTTGKYTISANTETFVLVGTFDNEYYQHLNPVTGKYVTSNPNCQRVHGDLVLESVDTKVFLDYNGKNCKYGLISYVIGTFEVTDSEGLLEINEGYGRITFVADHHSNNVSGQLKGSFE